MSRGGVRDREGVQAYVRVVRSLKVDLGKNVIGVGVGKGDSERFECAGGE